MCRCKFFRTNARHGGSRTAIISRSRPSILWNDQRTQKQCDEITELAGGLASLLHYTNNRMLTGYTGGKILWMKEEEPENYARTKVIVNPKDYIRYKLTGVICTEVSDASGLRSIQCGETGMGVGAH